MRRKILALLMVAGMMIIGVSVCGQTGENQDAGNQEQTEGETEEIEAKEPAPHSAESTASENTGAPVVYMTTDISSDGLMAIYEALGASPEGSIAVKLSTGEPGSNYLRTELIGELVQSLDASIVECNTAYGDSRSSTAMHYQVAEDHGYTAIATVDIMDENGSITLPVTGGSNLTENYVGANFVGYDYFFVLSHFKGHAMAEYQGYRSVVPVWGVVVSTVPEICTCGGVRQAVWGK